MAVSNVSFSAAVDEWVRQSEARMEAVFRQSCQRLVVVAQTPVAHGGNMPVDTGFLRASGIATTQAPVPVNPAAVGEPDKVYEFNNAAALGVLARLKIGQTLFFCWTAAYARRIEYGFNGTDSLGRVFNQRGRGFVRLAAQQWQTIVASTAREARNRSDF